jgi:hypothetical protein
MLTRSSDILSMVCENSHQPRNQSTHHLDCSPCHTRFVLDCTNCDVEGLDLQWLGQDRVAENLYGGVQEILFTGILRQTFACQ